MKQLILLRHAKAQADSDSGHDRDRLLTQGGEKDASRMGKALRKLNQPVEKILASSAPRAWRTAEIVAEKLGVNNLAAFDELYLAEPDVIADVIRRFAEGEAAMLVAHNPGMEEFAARMLGGPPTAIHLPTAGMVKIEFAVDQWSDIKAAGGQLSWLLTPDVVETL